MPPINRRSGKYSSAETNTMIASLPSKGIADRIARKDRRPAASVALAMQNALIVEHHAVVIQHLTALHMSNNCHTTSTPRKVLVVNDER